MVRAMLVVLAWSTAAVAETEAERVRKMVAALPELGTIERGRARVVVRGDVARAKQRAMIALADQVVADVARRFTQTDGDPHARIALCLLPDDTRYRAAAAAFDDIPSDWGFYRPDLRVAMSNLGASVGNLRHELVHPLIGDDFPGIPAWLNEGIAALYGTAKCNGRRCDFLVNYRLRDLQKAIADGTLPSIAELASSRDADVRGARAMTFYAMARYVLLFVEKQGKLSQLYAELRGAERAKHAQVLARYVDDAAFVTWAKKLRR